MDIIEVPEVTQLPELTGKEDPVDFANMLLTCLLRYPSAVLQAEHIHRDGHDSVSWIVRARDHDHDGPDIEIALSPSLASFRAVLARFGNHYMTGQHHGGCDIKLLKQHNRTSRCHFYMANMSQSGFWIRVTSCLAANATSAS